MNNVSFLIKPSSSKCNLNCKYCFYHNIADNRDVDDYGFMTLDTAKKIISKAFRTAKNGMIQFAFQGGEPTLIGLDFYIDFVNEVEKNRTNEQIMYSIQTNGLTLDNKWCIFLAKHGFLVGLSVDGTKKTHDLHRTNFNNIGTHSKIIETANLLKKHNVEFNVLTVVTKELSRYATKIYKYYKKMDFGFLQFIPCLDSFDGTKSKYSLSPDDYLRFLKQLFNLWYKDFVNDKYVSIRLFDNIAGMYLGYEPESCGMIGRCSIQNVIEADGSVYPCDFYVLDKYKIGNINDNEVHDMVKSNISKDFINESLNLNDKCKVCEWLQLCRGGCKRYYDEGINRFCKTYLEFHKFSYDRFIDIANIIKNRQQY